MARDHFGERAPALRTQILSPCRRGSRGATSSRSSSRNVLRQPGFRGIQHRVVGDLSASDTVMSDTFFVGVYPGLTPAMIDYMLESFEAFFTR